MFSLGSRSRKSWVAENVMCAMFTNNKKAVAVNDLQKWVATICHIEKTPNV